MKFSARLDSQTPNPIAAKRAQFMAAGVELTDLTDTNPTRHGLFDPRILEILSAHAARAGRYDPTPRGPWPARAALAERYGGDPEDYWLTASTSEAYGWLFTILADPGDAVAVPSPGYPLIEPLARLHDLVTSPYPSFYVHPSGWELDRSSFDGLAPRLAVAVNPNNPTGAYADPWIADACADKGIPLIADEVFFPFRLDELTDHPERAAVAEQRLPNQVAKRFCETTVSKESSGGNSASERRCAAMAARSPQASTSYGETITRLAGNDTTLNFGLDGLSKLLAAPQLKLGWIRLSGPRAERQAAADALDQVADSYLSVNSVVALALPDLLGLADESVARVRSRLATNLAAARDVFSDWRVRRVQGGWTLLLDLPRLTDPDSLCVALMERAGLYVHPGYFYDLPDSTLAVSLLPEPAGFRESCERLSLGLRLIDEGFAPSA